MVSSGAQMPAAAVSAAGLTTSRTLRMLPGSSPESCGPRGTRSSASRCSASPAPARASSEPRRLAKASATLSMSLEVGASRVAGDVPASGDGHGQGVGVAQLGGNGSGVGGRGDNHTRAGLHRSSHCILLRVGVGLCRQGGCLVLARVRLLGGVSGGQRPARSRRARPPRRLASVSAGASSSADASASAGDSSESSACAGVSSGVSVVVSDSSASAGVSSE